MKKNKKKYIIVILFLFLLCGIIAYTIIYNHYSYEWVEEKNSIVGQYRLHLKNGFGKYVDGHIDITYLNDKTETVEITRDGIIYVKNIIKKVENPRR
ncbi:MAG: hypothetical protein IJ568_03655 [Bacilli bacterium]|nr:hypothetical protein [Bacilli bacterium]